MARGDTETRMKRSGKEGGETGRGGRSLLGYRWPLRWAHFHNRLADGCRRRRGGRPLLGHRWAFPWAHFYSVALPLCNPVNVLDGKKARSLHLLRRVKFRNKESVGVFASSWRVRMLEDCRA